MFVPVSVGAYWLWLKKSRLVITSVVRRSDFKTTRRTERSTSMCSNKIRFGKGGQLVPNTWN